MFPIVLNNIKKITKYFSYFLLILIGTYIGTICIKFIFNLGVYLGNYLRCVYSSFV